MILALLAMLSGAPQMPTVVDCRIDDSLLQAFCAVTALHAGRFVVMDGTCDTGKHIPVVLWVDGNHKLHAEPEGSCE